MREKGQRTGHLQTALGSAPAARADGSAEVQLGSDGKAGQRGGRAHPNATQRDLQTGRAELDGGFRQPRNLSNLRPHAPPEPRMGSATLSEMVG